MWQGIDRRNFPRVNYPCKVIVLKDARREKFDTHTENIGIGGICIILDRALKRFTQVELILYLKDGLAPIDCNGRVVWVIGEDKFDTGVEFLDLKEEYHIRITKVVERYLKEEATS
jgi:hypothetical protein